MRNRGIDKMKKPEILAPAGTREAFLAAIYQGCDAIYLGGKDFGARAYATNFEWDELKELIQVAHLHNIKVYYTLNTLVKDIEIDRLNEVLNALETMSIDAIILQDLGVYKYIRDYFPGFVIHCSTQMNLHQINDVIAAKNMGFERVVLSRECSIEDIINIRSSVDIEIETFVHGALCYCYSGLCLMSSVYGERSGNRGKCAQPCRLAYTIDNEDAFYLSPKDQMTLQQLPLLIEAGIDSFKIEGRMKSAEYVGFATQLYRKYRDLYIALKEKNQADRYQVDVMDIENLKQLYNRGQFTPGYYEQHNNASMISYDHSKHIGIKVGQLTIKKGFHFMFDLPVAKEDLLEIHLDNLHSDDNKWPEFYLNADAKKGQLKLEHLYSSSQTKINTTSFAQNKTYPVYRIRRQALNNALTQEAAQLPRIVIDLEIEAKVDNPLRIRVKSIGKSKEHLSNESSANGLIEVFGSTVQKSNNRPMEAAEFKKQLIKTKDTPFDIDLITFDLDTDIFVPIKDINQLRRTLLEDLQRQLIDNYLLRHHHHKNSVDALRTKTTTNKAAYPMKTQTAYPTHLLISSIEQCEQVIDFISRNENNEKTETQNSLMQSLMRIYLDIVDFTLMDIKKAIARIRGMNEELRIKHLSEHRIELYLCFPHVFFEPYAYNFLKKLQSLDAEDQNAIHGFMVRTLGELEVAKGFNKLIALDTQLNLFNSFSIQWAEETNLIQTAAPSLELNGSGIKQIEKQVNMPLEIIVYQRTALMQSANCLYKTRNNRCDFKESGHALLLKDRKGMEQRVKCHCQVCYNTIYNEKPTYLMDVWKDDLSCNSVMRIDFTCETPTETQDILMLWSKTINNNNDTFNDKRFTRGHYKRGVK